MREYNINVGNAKKDIYPSLPNLKGKNKRGNEISFTNYYMEVDKKPFFAISGEFHFSRYNHELWEDELIKMKMGGINVVPTYIFWHHHEEIEGTFEWEGDKDLRKFIELCGKHKLYVIIRIGPFDHGEARNGGIPDWMFGRPFEIRSNDEGYLYYVRRLYKEIGKQVKGLLYKDDGPIIGTQLENEFQHAGAPWEITTGTSNEWLPGGRDGAEHMMKLKEIALDSGIDTPIYTGTGWGGAIAPTDEVLPLWGGYAYWPWIFYGDVEEHPATPNYIFRDYHNNEVPKTFDFKPEYKPENFPFACAEMMGGMTPFYNYRFKLPYESVDALSSIKVAGGCNFIGYYVYHGGSNPQGKKTPFLNETVTPKISYDYQAPIGEYGQVRESYHRLKRQHLFYHQYGKGFSQTKTVLSQNPENMNPEDVETLRYAVRADGDSGFIYINNFQDHIETKDQNDFTISVQLENETIILPNLSLAKDQNCILPFNFNMEGVNLSYSTTQLITELNKDDEKYYFFFTPKGMKGEYVFDKKNVDEVQVSRGNVKRTGNKVIVQVEQDDMTKLVGKDGQKINICTLTDQQSLNFWKVSIKGKETIFITEANVLVDDDQLRLEVDGLDNVSLKAFPAFSNSIVVEGEEVTGEKQGIFTEYIIPINPKEIELEVKHINNSKATINVDPKEFKNVKELLLKINYIGDIGYAFIDGELINDNYSNYETWEIGLKRFEKDVVSKGMYIYVSPIKEGVSVKSDSPMAARTEITEKVIAEIKSIKATPVYEYNILY
ncbi:beta-galactosidase [Gracilibacillus lacisalsi]|uniref:beta-galactosidase n=1 Tax=Gracilibacillus lacisalsi TaxID=393087 RepID=UPI00036094B5|nr:beta-galactosidase [Gracilibacillus lacisalsi]